MSAQHTHYDNLKVARNAPPEVIRAAYKSLAQKYHPDKYHDPVEAERIIKIINSAYEVLMDPEARAKYDIELGKQETPPPPPSTPAPATTEPVAANTKAPTASPQTYSRPFDLDHEEGFVNLKKNVLTVMIYGATVLVLALFTIKLIQAPPLKPELSTQSIPDKALTPLEPKPTQNIAPLNDTTASSTATTPTSSSPPALTNEQSSPPTATPVGGQLMRSPTQGEVIKPQKYQTASYENSEKLFKENRFVEAETMIDALLTQSPNDSRAWRLKGMLQASRGNTAAATRAFGTYLQTSNNSDESIATLKNIASGKNNVATSIQQAARQALINIGKE